MNENAELMESFARRMQNLIDEAATHGIILVTENAEPLPQDKRPPEVTDKFTQHHYLGWDETVKHPYLPRAEYVKASIIYTTTVPIDKVLQMKKGMIDYDKPPYELLANVRE